MRHRKCVLLPTMLAAALAGIGGLVPAASSAAAATGPAGLTCGGAWSIVASPNVSTANNALQGVAIVSHKNAWAVGLSTNTVTSVASTLTEHWNGTRWRIVPSPNAGSAFNLLQSVAAIPHTNQLWAVGGFTNSSGPPQTLVERWDGTDWDVVPSPSPGTSNNGLGAVVALSTTNAWAVGLSTTTGGSQALIEHWDGTSWSIASSPSVTGNVNLAGLTAVPGTSQLWASGGTGSGTLTEHFDGTSWSVVPSPNAPGSTGGDFLYGTQAVAAGDAWAVGSSGTGGNPVFTLTEHWDGTSWSVIPSPNPGAAVNVLEAVAPIPATTNLWAVGYEGSPSSFQTLAEHWDGTSWSVVASPNPSPYQDLLRSVATRGTEAWAVGSSTTTAGVTSTLIEHFC